MKTNFYFSLVFTLLIHLKSFSCDFNLDIQKKILNTQIHTFNENIRTFENPLPVEQCNIRRRQLFFWVGDDELMIC